MKIVDYIVLAVFVIALVAVCFFLQCSLDVYFVVLGFAVAAMSLVAMIIQGVKKNPKNK